MNDLEQATVTDLITELQKRCIGTLVIVVRQSEDEPDDSDFELRYSGSLTMAIGMASRAHSRLKTAGGCYDIEEEE